MRILVLALVLVMFVAGAAFSFINPQPVAIDYFLGTISLPLGLALVGVAIAGVLLAACCAWFALAARRAEVKHWKRKHRLLETELNNLRSLPIRDA